MDQATAELSPLYAEITADLYTRFGDGAHLCLVFDGGQLVSSLEYNEQRRAYEETLFNLPEIVSASALGQDALSAFTAGKDMRGAMTRFPPFPKASASLQARFTA